MLAVHQKGVGVCGVFTYEVAETKGSQVIDFARENQHPPRRRSKRPDSCDLRWALKRAMDPFASPAASASKVKSRFRERRIAR